MELQVNSMAPGAINDSAELQQLWLKFSPVVREHSNTIVGCMSTLGDEGMSSNLGTAL